MYRVTMKKNTLGDTRTAERMPTRAEFDVANLSHIRDVDALVASFVQETIERVNRHEWTKVDEPYATMFYEDMKANIEDEKAPFEELEWFGLHINSERHHLNRRVPDDVDLIDVIEMLADCVSAGMTRSGHVYEIKIPNNILQKAVSNTVKKMIGAVEIDDGGVLNEMVVAND